ncbi:hypothetical protein [Jiella mangrovi]|uniref:Uncharacterized protein n=1 Tax=Jiella mangrovi TaxID=2821407 RepID=A0ABS4BJX9_9HYPH|nr:hypothetical protein [Jiella mangrovi]MBP0617051.1 hypothetical protein [Jiella mangrovi]
MSSERLRDAILSARSEKATWSLGRQAFRREGLGAFNPFRSNADPERALWEEGFNFEREIAAHRETRL